MPDHRNPPAFPCHFPPDSHVGQGLGGMGLRDWFAGQALAGALAAEPERIYDANLALWLYTLADAMIAQREKEGEK